MLSQNDAPCPIPIDVSAFPGCSDVVAVIAEGCLQEAVLYVPNGWGSMGYQSVVPDRRRTNAQRDRSGGDKKESKGAQSVNGCRRQYLSAILARKYQNFKENSTAQSATKIFSLKYPF